MFQEKPSFSRQMNSLEFDEIDLLDVARFLHTNKIRLIKYFTFFAGIGIAASIPWYISRPREVSGRIVLSFKGIERREYPDGKKFSIEDFRAPYLLKKALADAKIPPNKTSGATFGVSVTPVIPQAVLKKWQKQDKDSTARDDYSPNEFQLSINVAELSDAEGRYLFDALVNDYKEQLRSQQIAALRLANDPSRRNFDELTRTYDYVDVPEILEEDARLLNDYLERLIPQASDFSDPVIRFEFRGIQNDLKIWSAVRLNAMKALISQGHLVKNRDALLMRTRYRLDDINLQIRSRSEEMDQAIKFLQSIPRAQPVIATPGKDKDEPPAFEAAVLNRLIASDYMAPLVKRISELREQTQQLKTQKWALENELSAIPKSRNSDPAKLIASSRAVFETGLRELQDIIASYNSLLEHYVTTMVTSLVTVTQGPIIRRDAPSFRLVLGGIVVLSAFLAVFCVSLEKIRYEYRR